MTSLFIGLYGVYLLLVGVRGNSGELLDATNRDLPGYIPWLFSIIAIAVLSENETTKGLVRPFIVLLILNFALMNWDTIESEVKKIYNMSGV